MWLTVDPILIVRSLLMLDQLNLKFDRMYERGVSFTHPVKLYYHPMSRPSNHNILPGWRTVCLKIPDRMAI